MQTRMLDVEGFILVGGASSRMGEDKSSLLFNGRSTTELIAAAMRPVSQTVRTVGSRAMPVFDLPNVPDLVGQWGPLGGIQAALRAAEAGRCLVVACDLPFVTTDLLQRLLDLGIDADATVPIQVDGHPQPLCAVYRRPPCLAAADQSIANGEHSPRALLDKVTTRYVPFAEISDLAQAEFFFFNVNTPRDRRRAEKIAAGLPLPKSGD